MSTWTDTIAKLAPMLATGLAGPLAGTAVTALEGVFGLTTDTSASTLPERLEGLQTCLTNASPEQLLAIKKADQDYAVTMATLGFKNVESLEALAAGDRDSARKREIEVKDWTPRIISYILIGGFMVMAGGVLFGTVRADTVLAGTVIGYLSAKAEQAVTYYLGSNASSQRKTELLSKADAIK